MPDVTHAAQCTDAAPAALRCTDWIKLTQTDDVYALAAMMTVAPEGNSTHRLTVKIRDFSVTGRVRPTRVTLVPDHRIS
jgi:hypothetical protein